MLQKYKSKMIEVWKILQKNEHTVIRKLFVNMKSLNEEKNRCPNFNVIRYIGFKNYHNLFGAANLTHTHT